MSQKSIAEILVETLIAAGVKRIYGVVGDSLNAILEQIAYHKEIEWIHVRNEETGAFAAGAQAHFDRGTCRLRRKLWSGQCAPGQRSLRLPPQPRTGTRHCRPYSQQ